MLPNPFPDHISFCLLPVHSTSNQNLHPAEENYLSLVSSPSRKQHYRSGRICAKEALSRLGIKDQPVLRDSDTREPLWPEDISGAITHSGNWVAAATGKITTVSGIGIDLEDMERNIDPGISRHVCIREENEWLEELDDLYVDQALKLIFSAKESIFKAFFPSTRIFLHFYDARIFLEDSIFQSSKPESFPDEIQKSQSRVIEFEYLILNREVIRQTGKNRGKGKAQFFESYFLTSVYY